MITLGTDSFVSVEDADALMAERLHRDLDLWPDQLAPDPDTEAGPPAKLWGIVPNGAYWPEYLDSENAARRAYKETALKAATRILNRERYLGSRRNGSQALAWPRVGVVTEDGAAIPSDAIPEDIARATAELAYQFLARDLDDPLTRRALHDLRSVMIGATMETYAGKIRDTLPENVRAMIGPYLASRGVHSAPMIP